MPVGVSVVGVAGARELAGHHEVAVRQDDDLIADRVQVVADLVEERNFHLPVVMSE